MDLEDEPQEFQGGTLQFNADENKALIVSGDKQNKISDVSENKESNSNNRVSGTPWGNSLIAPIVSIPGRKWNKKQDNQAQPKAVTVRPSAVLLLSENPNDFFTFRQNIVQQAVKECVDQFLDLDADGPLTSAYLLTEISLWDTDKERLVLLTPNTLVSVKYDFIALQRLSYKKMPLECIDTVFIGDLVYPSASIVPHLHGFADGVSGVLQRCFFESWSKSGTDPLPHFFQARNRNMQGIRLMWNKGKPLNFSARWNPLNNNVPFTTYTSHPLLFHKDCTNESQQKMYDIEQLVEEICTAITNLKPNEADAACVIQHENILLTNYVGVGSLIHNRNALGFFKVRGKFSF